jgi:hypothetical protein
MWMAPAATGQPHQQQVPSVAASCPLPLPPLAVLALSVLALARLPVMSTADSEATGAAMAAEDPPDAESDADGGPSCTLVQQPGVRLNPRLFGYNLEVYGTMINNSFSDTAGLAIADALHLGALRYPGGTMSNVFDPIHGRYTETTAAGGAYKEFAMYAKIIEGAGPPGTFSAARFMEGIGGRSRAVIWDLNVFSFNTSRACAQIEYIATLPPPPAGLETFLELGNELYSRAQGMPRFPTGASYAEAMAPIVRCARAALPSAKIAAVGYSAADSSAWVKGVAEHAADFDAVSIHVYSPGNSAVDKYNKTPGGGIDDQLTYVMGYSRTLMHAAANRSVADFGAEKKLWMTEFNYGLQADIFLPELDFGALHGIFHASRILAAVELHNRFDALTFQTFVHPIPYPPYASAYHRSMPVARISPLPDRPDLAKISGTAQLVSHMAFHALRSETMHPVQSVGCAQHGNQPCLQAAAFATAQNSSIALALVNICQRLVQARMASRPPPTAASYAWTVYSAKDPGGWGAIPTDPDKLPWDTGPLRPTHTTGATLPMTLTFPPLSFSVLQTGSNLHETPPSKTDDSAGGGGLLQPPTTGPCDIYDTAGTPCVGAHSMVRALYGAYAGPLYVVHRTSDNSTITINVSAPGGFADSAPQDAFCVGPVENVCIVLRIFDQSPQGNHLDIAPPEGGSGAPGHDKAVIATQEKLSVGGHPVYGARFEAGMGYRNDKTSGIARGDEPESIYMVTSGKHWNGGCCFDYGNAETDATDHGPGTMEAVYWGNYTDGSQGSGKGPWVMADLENGVWAGNTSMVSSNTPIVADYVTAMVKGNSGNWWTLKGGSAQSGALTTLYDGARPHTKTENYSKMKKQGAIILGIGGDNSKDSAGIFYEGVMTSGFASNATDAAVQANIVAAGYGQGSALVV